MPCFERDWTAEQICRAIRALPIEKARLMEVCGTHTVAIARSGIRRMLPPCVEPCGWGSLPERSSRSYSRRRCVSV